MGAVYIQVRSIVVFYVFKLNEFVYNNWLVEIFQTNS